MKRVRSILAIFMIAALFFTSVPALGEGLDVHAASVKKPVKVTSLKKYAAGTDYIHFQWGKIKKNKNTKGYAIYLNGKLYKRVGVKTYRYKIPKLKSNTAYKVSIRAYNTYKQKQYYNSKTKKWQTKKPAKKNWKGKKTRKVTAYAYGPASATLTIKTTTSAPVQQNPVTVTNPTTPKPVHQHNYNIPIYGELADVVNCTVWHCDKCEQTYVTHDGMSDEEGQAIADMRTKHKTEFMYVDDGNGGTILDPTAVHNGYYTTETMINGWIPHQIIGWKCECGSKNYEVDSSLWRNEEL